MPLGLIVILIRFIPVSNASCLLVISKWDSPIGDLVACRSEVREVMGLSPRLTNNNKKKKKATDQEA